MNWEDHEFNSEKFVYELYVENGEKIVDGLNCEQEFSNT